VSAFSACGKSFPADINLSVPRGQFAPATSPTMPGRQRKRGRRSSRGQRPLPTIVTATLPVGQVQNLSRPVVPVCKPGGPRATFTTILQSRQSATQDYVYSIAPAGPYFGQLSVLLSQMGNAAQYATVFDSYRINWVEFSFELNSGTTTTTVASSPRLIVSADFDDSNVPTDISQINGRPQSQQHQFWPTTPRFVFAIEPRPAVPVFNSGVFSGYTVPDKPVYVDSSNTSVPHYGIKFFAGNYNGGDTTSYINISYRASVTFRDPI
jgi:hypothetical protein